MAAMASGQLTATSNVNLVENIGFGPDATHTTQGAPRLAPPQSFPCPPSPVPVTVDRMADAWATRATSADRRSTTIDRVRQYALAQRRAR